METGTKWDHAAEKPVRERSKIDIFDKIREPGETGRLITTKNEEKVEEKRVEQEGFDMDYEAEKDL